MGIIVNFTTRTVQGFGEPSFDYPVKITWADDVTIWFEGHELSETVQRTTEGTIDRITGDVGAYVASFDPKTLKTAKLSYALKCRPTERVF
jgi:hypothetical protein